MKLAWMLLANHAEEAGGLLYLSGATWDTINVVGPPPPHEANAVALFPGALVVRALYHPTETGQEHQLRVVIMDEDGGKIAEVGMQARVERSEDLPVGWEQGLNFVVTLAGMPLPKFGTYAINVLFDNQHVGDLHFRVVKRY